MVILAYNDTPFKMSIEAAGVYVSHLLKRLNTDPRYSGGPDDKCRHFHKPCNCLEVYVIWYVPPFFASYITHRLITYVSVCYTERIIDCRFCSACEEISF